MMNKQHKIIIEALRSLEKDIDKNKKDIKSKRLSIELLKTKLDILEATEYSKINTKKYVYTVEKKNVPDGKIDLTKMKYLLDKLDKKK